MCVCEVLVNPSRYHNQVIAIEGEHRWLCGDQILYDATCRPAGGAVLTPAPEDKTDTRIPPDTPLNVLRVSLEFIAKGRFEAWQPGVDGFESGRKGPNFVIELRSQTGRIRVLRDKMEEWLANGAQLAWLIDAEARTVEIYRPGYEAETRTRTGASASVAGEGPAAGFVLHLAPVWDPLAE